MFMTPFEAIAANIIQEQERIIGPLARNEAKKVGGIEVQSSSKNVSVHITSSNPKNAIDSLVAQYERLFGRASHEVCKEAAASLLATLAATDIPSSLAA